MVFCGWFLFDDFFCGGWGGVVLFCFGLVSFKETARCFSFGCVCFVVEHLSGSKEWPPFPLAFLWVPEEEVTSLSFSML